MARRTGFAKKIEVVHWTYGSFVVASMASASPVATNVLSAQHLPETLLRVRGEWAAWFEGVQTGGQGVSLAAGLILVPEGTGTTVLWSPITDGDAPWFWWDNLTLAYEEYVVDVLASNLLFASRRVIDSKAMRKNRNMEVQFVAEQGTLTGFSAASVNCAGSARFLAGS